MTLSVPAISRIRETDKEEPMGELKVIRLLVGMVMTNCYLAYNDDSREAFVVDPGDGARQISSVIREQKLELKGILLTHGHFDHMLAVPELKQEFAVPIYAHEKERELLADSQMNLSGAWIGRPTSIRADVWLKDGETFEMAGFAIQAIFTPGHTAGGVSYYIEAEKALFCGDTLFCESYGRTDLPTASGREIAWSINEQLLPLPEDVVVYPGHQEETTIGHERTYNPLSKGAF